MKLAVSVLFLLSFACADFAGLSLPGTGYRTEPLPFVHAHTRRYFFAGMDSRHQHSFGNSPLQAGGAN